MFLLEFPKGQVFENDKMGQTRTENLISSHHFEGDYYTLNPEEKYIEIPAYCLNENNYHLMVGKEILLFIV